MRFASVVVFVLTSWLAAPLPPPPPHRDRDVHSTVTTTAHYSDVIIEGLNSARCLARCLSRIKISFAKTLSACHRNSLCNSCALPCERIFNGIDSCKNGCKTAESEDDCIESCQFLLAVTVSRPGVCPPVPSPAAEWESTDPMMMMCVKTCDNDDDCPPGLSLKCCNDDCGRNCQQPTFDLKGVPEVPDQPQVRHRVKLRAIEVRWRPTPPSDNDDEDPPSVVYVVSSRAISDRDGSELRVLPWRQIAQTTATSIVVTDVIPMTSYQFTVTAVNVIGFRSPSKPSKALLVPPGKKSFDSPGNLTQAGVTFLEDTVSVLLQWTPPISHQVTKYKVSWNEEAEEQAGFQGHGKGKSVGKEYKQSIPGTEVSLRIHGLKPETSYKVQVQAVWQDKTSRSKSNRATAFISTHRTPRTANQIMAAQEPSYDSLQLLVIPAPISSLTVGEPYFQNGLLKANVSWTLENGDGGPILSRNSTVDKMLVYWSPETCAFDGPFTNGMAPVMSAITQDRYFVAYDLRFDCQYLIRVQPVSSQGVTGTIAHVTMATPSCRQVNVVGDVRPDCPNSTLRVPEEPPDLEHSFFISGSEILARITWGLPQSDAPITGYQVNWNQSPPLTSPRLAAKNATSGILRIFAKENRTASISSLAEATTYEVIVQATSKAGLGQKATTFIITPRLQRPAVLSSSLDDFFGDRFTINQTLLTGSGVDHNHLERWRSRSLPPPGSHTASQELFLHRILIAMILAISYSTQFL